MERPSRNEVPGANSFDLVIVTKDRPGPLGALLGDIQLLSRPPGKVVIVDDSVRAIPWRERFPQLPLETVRPESRGFISKSKNLGWKRCTAEFVGFVDDDNRIPSTLLERLADDLTRNPRWGAVMPGVLYHRRPDLVWVYATPFRRDRWGFTLIGRNRPRDPRFENRYLPTDALPNLSMVRAEALSEVGAFDERLPVNSSADFCQRLKRSGWQAFADTGALTRHDVEAPGVPGYWAQHTVQNPERCRLEVADWFRFHRRWNGTGALFGVRASYHALGFMVPQVIAATIHTEGRTVATTIALIRGARDGLRFSPVLPPVT